MSELGITTTILATQLTDAVRKDEAPEERGLDLRTGLFGRHVSDWLRMVSKELVDRKTGCEAKLPDAVLSSQLKAALAAFELLDNACDSGNPLEIGKAQIKGRGMISSSSQNVLSETEPSLFKRPDSEVVPSDTPLPCRYCGLKTSQTIQHIPPRANSWTNSWRCYCHFCEHPSSEGSGPTKHDAIADYNHKQQKT